MIRARRAAVSGADGLLLAAGRAPFGRRLASRMAAIILTAALVFSTAVSCLLIVEYEHHDCVGDDCPVCLVLDLSQAMLTSAAAPPSAAGCISLAVLAAVGLLLVLPLLRSVETPITLHDTLLV